MNLRESFFEVKEIAEVVSISIKCVTALFPMKNGFMMDQILHWTL